MNARDARDPRLAPSARIRAAVSLVAVVSCVACMKAPSAGASALPPEPFVAEATLGLAPARGGSLVPGAPAAPHEPKHVEPTLGDLVETLRSGGVADALTAETSLAIGRLGVDGVVLEAREEAGTVKISVRATSRSTALIACRAWERLAEARAGNDGAADPMASWLRDEARRLEREIAAIGRELALLPPRADATDADEMMAAAMRLRVTMAGVGDGTGALDPSLAEVPLVRALLEMRNEASLELEQARGRGYGERHPWVSELRTRAAWITKRLAAQIANERWAADDVVATLRALAPRPDPSALARAVAERIQRVDLEHTSSLDPRALQLIAVEDSLLGADEAVMALHLGVAHPRRIALVARRAALVAEHERARQAAAVHIGSMLAVTRPAERSSARAPRGATPDRALQARAVELAAMLARLVDDRDAARGPAWIELGSCHATR